ncbi:hypothetical protein BDZ45DRAFT_754395 [Acephala macrosclerotiorum]|nr:hypothetical protein BDZ45DRAFT_754395 [Acephala macrosclerotiorum]
MQLRKCALDMDVANEASREAFLESQTKRMEKCATAISDEQAPARPSKANGLLGRFWETISTPLLKPWRASEEPKIAISTSRTTASLRIALNIIPFDVCNLTIALNLQGYYTGAQTTS